MGFKNLVALGNDRLTCRKLNCVVRIMLYDNGVNKGMIAQFKTGSSVFFRTLLAGRAHA
jgi:hypothetical protein